MKKIQYAPHQSISSLIAWSISFVVALMMYGFAVNAEAATTDVSVTADFTFTTTQNGKGSGSFSFDAENWQDGWWLQITPTPKCDTALTMGLARKCEQYLFSLSMPKGESYRGAGEPWIKKHSDKYGTTYVFRPSDGKGKVTLKSFLNSKYKPGTLEVMPVPDWVFFQTTIYNEKGEAVWNGNYYVRYSYPMVIKTNYVVGDVAAPFQPTVDKK